jgi:4-oxalocrotonate tautomerase
MPFIQVRPYESRTFEQKRAFVEAVTRETARTFNCPTDAVDIVLDDVKKSD